ncbi:MAG: fasciclin domain-containing protein [Bacteroidota bacterium]
MKKRILETIKWILLVLAVPLILTQTTQAQTEKNIVQIASANPDFSILVEAVVKAELIDALSGEEDLTVFAPTNAAFQKLFAVLGVHGIDELAKEDLTPILLYHVLAGKILSTDLSDGQIATTLNGSNFKVGISEAGVTINESNVVATDVEASNGVIHVIDMVLSPPMNIVEIASANSDFSILVEAVVKAELVDALSGEEDLTVFAPTNAAFEKLFAALGVHGIDELAKEDLTPILLYHVLGGTTYAADLTDGLITSTLNGSDVKFSITQEGAKINDSNIIATDIIASNGAIHVIDMVLSPPMNIVEIASANPDFSILVEAVVKAELVDALTGEEDLTVFAPTNAAFQKLFAALGVHGIDELAKEDLTPILLYHVLGGVTYSSALSDEFSATTLNGRLVTFTVNEEGIKVNESTIDPADIIASNGVIHVIDQVLLPPNDAVVSFTLVDAETNEDLFEITEGMVIDLAEIGDKRLNIRANVSPERVGSVKFGLNGRKRFRVENIFPYALFSDIRGNYFNWRPRIGDYALTATPYTRRLARGEAGTALTVNFSIISSAGVSGFTLVDAITDEDIMPISDGDVIQLTTLINIRADLNINSDNIRRVKFALNDNENHRIERVFPYALFGDRRGDYSEWQPAPGMYTITATPILRNGSEAASLTIKIEIVDNAVNETAQRKVLNGTPSSKINFYPNPTIQNLNLEMRANAEDQVKVMVLDLNGRVFINEDFNAQNSMYYYQLNVSALQRGVYILSVESNSQAKQVFRFIKD